MPAPDFVDIWVDSDNGVDGHNGSFDNPVRSLNAAIGKCHSNAKHRIRVKNIGPARTSVPTQEGGCRVNLGSTSTVTVPGFVEIIGNGYDLTTPEFGTIILGSVDGGPLLNLANPGCVIRDLAS